MKKFIKGVLIVLFAFFLGYFFVFKLWANREQKPENPNPPVEEPEKPVEPEQPDEQKNPLVVELEKEKYYIPDRLERYINYKEKHEDKSIKEVVTEVNCNIDYEFYTHLKKTDVSKGTLMLVNKFYYLEEDYEPENKKQLTPGSYTTWWEDPGYLSGTVYDSYVKMLKDAYEEGYDMVDTSPYRSYDYQRRLYNQYVNANGKEEADRFSARPGHSEHQTGFASDVISTSGGGLHGFEATKEFTWMQNNAYKYGFILRYPKGKEYLTGYKYEAWHYRYVGKEVAEYIHENDIVFEEYYAYFCEYKNEC